MMVMIVCQDESSRKKMKVVDGSGAGQRAKVAGRQPSLAHIRRIFLPFPPRDSLTFQNCLLIIPFPLSCNLLHVRLLNLDHLHNLQGAFFNCSAQISVLKRKTLFHQRRSFVHQEFHGTESLIGCPSFFILVLKIGRNS